MNYVLYLYGLVAGPRSPATDRALAEYWAGDYSGVLPAGVFTGADLQELRAWLWNSHSRPVTAELVARVQTNADLEQIAIFVREELADELQMGTRVWMSLHSLDFIDWPTGEPEPPGQFLLTSRPDDLLARAYLELALEMTAGVAVSACPEDGRMFAVRDPRQVYCTTQCAGRARYRKWAQRKKASSDPHST
jgi:hypothetical protein